MIVSSFDFDITNGFYWIIVEGKEPGEQWTVQCCLKSQIEKEEDGSPKSITFLHEIDMADCGHNEGMCGDANAKAFAYWGENHCMTALFEQAKIDGIKLICAR